MQKVGIMMSVFNGECYIEKALDSVLTQTYPEVYPIAYDDGSTDDTWKLLREYEKRDDRITILRGKKNKGLPAGDNAIRRHILEKTDFPLVAWLAADDQWRRDKIETQVAYLENNPDVDITYTDTVFLTEDGKASTAVAPEYDFNLLCNVNFINGSSVMWRRIVLETLKWNEDYQNAEDWDFHIRSHKEGFVFRRVEGMLTANLRHGGNISQNREREAYYHAKVCLAHKLPLEIAAARLIRLQEPKMLRGILKAWTESQNQAK